MAKYREQMTPRNGVRLVVVIVARISGCASQKDISLDDQIESGKQIAGELYPSDDIDWIIIQTKAKGEALDRPELEELERILKTRTVDLLIAEDLGRIVRGTAANDLCGLAVDCGTRVISPNDCIDTADGSWEEDVIAACRDHVGHNSHTSKRIKRKLFIRFKRDGLAAQPIAGYLVPDEVTSYFDWRRDEAAVPVIREGYELLLRSLNCSAVADLFNSRGFLPGPYCRREKWDGSMVRRLFANTILKGKPGRGFKHSVKHHQSGRRKSVRKPEGPEFIDCPELAILTEEEFDTLNRTLTVHNQQLRRGRRAGDPRLGLSTKRTRFPGQFARCWYCGSQFVWGGNGIANHLQCSGARKYRCWNSLGIDGELLGRRLCEELATRIALLPDIEVQLEGAWETACETESNQPALMLEELTREEAELAAAEGNLARAIAEWGPKPILAEQLSVLEKQRRELTLKQWKLLQQQEQNKHSRVDVSDWKRQLSAGLTLLARDSYEFNDWIREIVTDLDIFVVRLIDGGHPCPRAAIRFNLLPQLVPERIPLELQAQFTGELTIDLFEPVQREAIRTEVVRLRQQGVKLREIGPRIEGQPTYPAVQRAWKLHSIMAERGLASPYELVQAPPADYAKLRRHLHKRYQFAPCPEYEQRVII